MALTEDPRIEEVDAEDGASVRRKFMCEWDERRTVAGIPRYGELYGDGSLLAVRRRQFTMVPTADEDAPLCEVTVEYSTPRRGSQEVGDISPDDPDADPTVSAEDISTELVDLDTVGAFELTNTEELISSAVRLRYAVLIYRKRLVLTEDRTLLLADYLDSVNNADVNVGNRIAFAAAEGRLWFSGFGVSLGTRKFVNPLPPFDDAYKTVFETDLEFRFRRVAPWNYEWVNPEPIRTPLGAVVVYNDAKPFQPNGPHRWGDVALKPVISSGDNLKLDYSKIGWQEITGKTVTGATSQATIYPHPPRTWGKLLTALEGTT